MKLIELPRLLERDAARELVGTKVPTTTPNVAEECVIRDAASGEAVAMYAPLRGDSRDLRWAVRNAEITNGVPRAGMDYRSRSVIFGSAPRKPFARRESCRAANLAVSQPDVQGVLDFWADRLQAMLEADLPEEVIASQKESAAILPDWRMTSQTLWTSGVINDTVSMPYHTDSANFDVWSAMPVFRRGVDGGRLDIPEYGATIECRDAWAVWFPGYRLVHGVTPIKRRMSDGYRISAVYYALRGMKDCATTALETAHAKAKRTERERRAAAELAERLGRS